MWGAKQGRKKQSVLPEGDDTYDKTAKPLRLPPQRQVALLGEIRWSSPRTWIWLLLIGNLVVVLVFIFLSAQYFPKAITPEHQSPLLSDSHDAKDDTGTHRPFINMFESRVSTPGHHEAEETQSEDALRITEPTVTALEYPRSEPTGDPIQNLDKRDHEHPIIDADEPLKERKTNREVLNPSAEDFTQMRLQPTEEPKALDQGVKANGQLPSHIAGMLERVKASRQKNMDGGATGGTDPVNEDKSLGIESSDLHSTLPQANNTGSDATATAFNKDLFVWLKADDGVEIVDKVACLQSQNPDACELTSWTNHIRSSNALVPTAFKPASTSLRPVWVPKASANGTDLPSVAFSCPLKAKHATFPESMTLFFVLLPTHIEPGDAYAGQKFFGSSPYGQFALHGGKPAFFGSTGLIELEEVMQSYQPSILIYRLQRHSVEIKVHGRRWSPPLDESRPIRLSQNSEISLGNVKAVCDTNAFRGQIYEVMLYSAALDNDRVALIEAYLESRYIVSSPAATAGMIVSVTDDTEQPEVESPKLEVEADETFTIPPLALAESDPVEGRRPATRGDDEQGKDTLDTPSSQPEGTTAPINDFNPELVFEWVPSQDLLAAKSLPPAVAEQWKSSVQEKIEIIQNFQLGGEVLREFIHEQKEELLRLHDELFG